MSLKRQQYDVVVIGSGGAGSSAADTAAAQGARVLVVSKDPIVCSDSKISEGIVTVRGSGSPRDTPEALDQNMRIQGDDLAEPGLTDAFAKDSTHAYNWLRDHGLRAHTHPDTQQPIPLSIPMGGHTLPRSVDHANGGLDYAHACWNAITSGHIDYLEDAWFLELYQTVSQTGQRRIAGGLIYHASEGEWISVCAHAVILACGGLSTLYFPNTDTMRGNTGDAYAIAARAGAQLVDMEQVQFIPFAIADGSSYHGLVVGEPVSAGVLGVLRDKDGQLIQSEIMVRTRAECAAAIAKAVAEGRGTDNDACFLDLTENSHGKAGAAYTQLMKDKIPGLLKTVRNTMGAKAARFEAPWEVRPSAHYLMGGVRANEQCEVLDHQHQVILGLYVAGQAMGGLHGSNRLGSTSLAEGVIFGRRAGHAAAQLAHQYDALSWDDIAEAEHTELHRYQNLLGQKGTHHPIALTRTLQQAAWQHLGPGRTQSGIEEMRQRIQSLMETLPNSHVEDDLLWNQNLIDYIECQNLLTCAQAIALSAQDRAHSLGAHVRLDHITRAPSSHYSTACHMGEQPHHLELTRLPRARSSRWIGTKIRLQQHAKIVLFKVIRRLPNQWKDAILHRIYQRVLNRDAAHSSTEQSHPL